MKFDIKYRIQYHETDKMGIVHHSNYLKYLEFARIEMFRSYGISYKEIEEKGIIMPVHNVNIIYKRSLFYDDIININVNVLDVENVSTKMVFDYIITNQNEEICSVAKVIVVFLDSKTNSIIRDAKRIQDIIKK